MLVTELRSEAPDVSVLRQCVVASLTAPLSLEKKERLELWSWLLLGHKPQEDSEDAEDFDEDSVEEIRVLEADVRRTRQEEPYFRDHRSRHALKRVLARFCHKHGTPYRQGLNELAAPFVFLDASPKVTFMLFDRFVQRFADQLYGSISRSSTRKKSSLLCACRLFGAFMSYHDPRLASHLADAGFSPALYATPWLLTLMARNVGNIQSTLNLYDAFLAYDDPALVFGLGFATLRAQRDVLLELPAARVPELLARHMAPTKASFPALAPTAIASLKQTPPSFRRALTYSLSRPSTENNEHWTRILEALSIRATPVPTLNAKQDDDNARVFRRRRNPPPTPGLGLGERQFWLPSTVVFAEEVVEALCWADNGAWSKARVVVVDAAPPGEPSRLAAGRLADSVWPTVEYLAFGGSPDEADVFLGNWARSRVTGDASLRGKHVVVIGTADGPRRRRRDTIAEALLPRDLLRKGASLIHAMKQPRIVVAHPDDLHEVPPASPDLVSPSSTHFSDLDDDDNDDDIVVVQHSDAIMDNDDVDAPPLTDAVAEAVAYALREAGVPRVSTLERRGFEKIVDAARDRGVLDFCLPHFDDDQWNLYLTELAASKKHLPPEDEPPPFAHRIFDAVRRDRLPRIDWSSWIERVPFGVTKPPDPPSPTSVAADESPLWSAKLNAPNLLDDSTFDESYF